MTTPCCDEPISDILFIHGLRVDTIIGIYDWEKQAEQPLIFDIELSTSLVDSAQSDAINDTVNYKTVSDDIIEWVKASRFELIETLAEQLCQRLFNHYPKVSEIALTLNKPHAVIAANSVGLKIRRRRSSQ